MPQNLNKHPRSYRILLNFAAPMAPRLKLEFESLKFSLGNLDGSITSSISAALEKSSSLP